MGDLSLFCLMGVPRNFRSIFRVQVASFFFHVFHIFRFFRLFHVCSLPTISKEFLQRVMAKDAFFTPELIKSIVPTGQASVRRALRSVSNPVAKLRHLRQLVAVLVKQLSRKSATFPLGASDRVSAADRELDRGIEADEVSASFWSRCMRGLGVY